MSEKVLREYYDKQLEFMKVSQMRWMSGDKSGAKQYAREILYYGDRILRMSNGNEMYLSGPYQNMATAKYALYLYSDDKDLTLVHEALEYVEKALWLKPTNQVALANGISLYVLIGDLRKAAGLVDQLTPEGFVTHLRVFTVEMMQNALQCKINLESVNELMPAIDHFYDSMENKIMVLEWDDNAKKVLLTAMLSSQANLYYCRIGDMVKAYAIMERALRDRPEDAQYRDSYILMCQICLDLRLNKVQEARKYGELAYKYSGTDIEDKQKANILSCYGSALCRDGDATGLEKCKEAVNIYPADVTVYNYARSLYCLHNYEEAFPWAKKALFYAEEDMNLLLMADIYLGLKQVEEAVRYYIKAYHLLLNTDQLTAFRFVDHNGITMVNYSAPPTLTYYLRYTLKQLVRCYLGKDQYKAKSWLCVAEELFPEDESFDLMKDALEAIDVSREEVQRLKQELTTVKEETEKQRKMSADLVKKLISIQDESQALDLDNAEDWETFSGKIEKIIQSLEAQARNNKKLMQETKERILKKYPFLKDKAVQFLTTAEALYEIHKGTEIDYACIVIEYVKVCEIQLRERLSHILSPNDKMLGNIIYVITNNGVVPYNSHLRELNKINSLRRKSAHTGVLGQQDVEAIKKIYFDDGFLQVLK